MKRKTLKEVLEMERRERELLQARISEVCQFLPERERGALATLVENGRRLTQTLGLVEATGTETT